MSVFELECFGPEFSLFFFCFQFRKELLFREVIFSRTFDRKFILAKLNSMRFALVGLVLFVLLRTGFLRPEKYKTTRWTCLEVA